ncbi:uncharacterized protein BO97DRAFT_176793 [Aspergillus homomorphus CBS 101889]|uniref:F-box domain-containing protein n=1 Tax=Aspergillus homomorphus (strain CBS 101889) TaxID=1450537 RepID=A0A395I6R0_ASPHC|nr:hypothetical protein BO97DRAFT_176793 [Aspergillus homomorphus CBS 101889]RAL15891.1 hypothetical protein BO97DRAFT_176793 [Aspergillus homomorphus CBS 101889]
MNKALREIIILALKRVARVVVSILPEPAMPRTRWLEALPGEIHYAIFDYLQFTTLKNVSCVSKCLRTMVLPLVFRHIVVKFSQSSLDCLNDLAASNLRHLVTSLEFQACGITKDEVLPDRSSYLRTGSETAAREPLVYHDTTRHGKDRAQCVQADTEQAISSLLALPRLKRLEIMLHQPEISAESLVDVQGLYALCQDKKYNVTGLCILLRGLGRARRQQGLNLESVCLSNLTYPAFSTDGQRGELAECLWRLLDGVPFLELTGDGFPLELLCHRDIGLQRLGLQNLTVSFQTLRAYLRTNSRSVRWLDIVEVGLTHLPEGGLGALSLSRLLTRE